MDAKIFMSLSELSRDLLVAFLLGIVLGMVLGGLLVLKFNRHFRQNNSKWR